MLLEGLAIEGEGFETVLVLTSFFLRTATGFAAARDVGFLAFFFVVLSGIVNHALLRCTIIVTSLCFCQLALANNLMTANCL